MEPPFDSSLLCLIFLPHLMCFQCVALLLLSCLVYRSHAFSDVTSELWTYQCPPDYSHRVPSLDSGLCCVGHHRILPWPRYNCTSMGLYIGFDLIFTFWGHGESIVVKSIQTGLNIPFKITFWKPRKLLSLWYIFTSCNGGKKEFSLRRGNLEQLTPDLLYKVLTF